MQNSRLATLLGRGTGRKPSRMGALASADDPLRLCLFSKDSAAFCLSQTSLPRLLVNFTSCPSLPTLPASSIHSRARLSVFIHLGLQAESDHCSLCGHCKEPGQL